MTQSRRTPALCFWSLLLVVVLLMTFVITVSAQIRDSLTVVPVDIAFSGDEAGLDALASTDMTLGTVKPATGKDDESSATSLLRRSSTPQTLNTLVEHSATASPSNNAPGVIELPPGVTIVPPGVTAIPPGVTIVPPGVTAIPPGVTATPPGVTEIPPGVTATPPGVTETPPGVTAIPPGVTETPPGVTEILPGVTEVPPRMAGAPTTAPLSTDALSTGHVATHYPANHPATTSVTTAPAATTPTSATTIPATIPTEDTTTLLPFVPPRAIPTLSPNASESTPGRSGLDSISTSGSIFDSSNTALDSADNSVKDMSTEGTEGKELTLAPITPDDTDIKANAPTDTYDSSSGPNASASSDQSLDGWKLALVIIGAVCVVVASIYFVHKHHVRNAAANKRDRDSFEQRALESFFGQNRVTVPRETAVSSLNFVTDILTPRNGNAASTLFGKRSNTEMQMAVARSTAQGFHQSATSSIHRPTDNYHTNEFDPFTANESLITSSKTSPVIQSESEYFSTSSVSLGSIAPSILSSQGSLQPSIFDVGIRNTNLTDRSNSGFSVSLALSDSEIYRMSDQIPEGSVLRRGAPQLSASTKLRGYSSRNSDDFSIDESYVESFRTRLTQDNFSFFTTDSYETQTTQGIDDDDEDILSTTLSKNSEMSEGEI